jgi:sialate O-acetylesterase
MIKNQSTFWYRLLLLSLFSAFYFGLSAEVKLPRLIADGMVLQRDTVVKIWGWADPAERVRVVFNGTTYRTKAGKDGSWEVRLAATPAGGPHEMQINEQVLGNILVGDVWLSSGQSNMELPIRRVLDLYADEIDQVNNTHIRMFRSSTRTDFENPQSDYPDGAWREATPEHIMDFSAVAWFFADELYRKYGVPIGIVSTAIGGSPAESWLSPGSVDEFLSDWQVLKDQWDAAQAEALKDGTEPYIWQKEVNRLDEGAGLWSGKNVDVSDWALMSLPGYWSDKGLELRNGSVWFHKTFEVPESLVNADAVLRLGRIIDSDSAFVNGVFVGTTSYQYPPRIYPLPSGVLKPGVNTVMVRVFSQGGRGGLVEEKPYELRLGSEVIDLSGDWHYHVGAELNPPRSRVSNPGFMPGGLYNGLIHPAVNYGFNGVIWYQGESNAGRAHVYRQLFEDMIKDWRNRLGVADLPFIYAQLANLGVPSKQPVETGWAALQDAQRRVLALPNTGMAVTYDIGEWNDIHPLNKKELGRRLALEAYRVAYNDAEVVSSGPLYESAEIKGNSMVLTFSSVGSGLYANSLLQGFQIAGEDGVFVWANAVVLTKNTVRVWSSQIPDPSVVRYAWDGNPSDANLKNKEGLPASPFSTKASQ